MSAMMNLERVTRSLSLTVTYLSFAKATEKQWQPHQFRMKVLEAS